MAHKPLESVKRLECHFFYIKIGGLSLIHLRGCQYCLSFQGQGQLCTFHTVLQKGQAFPYILGLWLYLGRKKSCKVFCKASCHIAASWPLLAIVSGGSWSEFFDQGKSYSALASLQICRCHSGHRFAACWQTTHDQSMPFLFEETCQPDRGRRPQDTDDAIPKLGWSMWPRVYRQGLSGFPIGARFYIAVFFGVFRPQIGLGFLVGTTFPRIQAAWTSCPKLCIQLEQKVAKDRNKMALNKRYIKLLSR